MSDMGDINVNHKIEFTNSSLEAALSSLTETIAKMNTGGTPQKASPSKLTINMPNQKDIVKSMDGLMKGVKSGLNAAATADKRVSNALNGLSKSIKADADYTSKNIAAMSKLTNATAAHTQAIKTSKTTPAEAAALAQVRNAADSSRAKDLSNIRMSEKQARDAMNDKRSWEKFGKGMVLGGVLSAAYMGSQFGSTAGKEAGSINQSAANYLGFQQSLYNMQMQNQSNLATTISGAIGGAIGGVIGSIIPGVGTALGAGIGGVSGTAIGGYFSGKTSEEDKAKYAFATNKELQAWRMQQLGISGASSQQYQAGGNILGNNKSKFQMTNLLEELNKTDAYAMGTADFALSGRRDVVGRMSNSGLSNFGKKSQQAAMSIGADPASFMNAIAQMSATTGKSTESILKKTMENAVKYGGDANSNLMKIQQILQTTPLGDKAANNLVWGYQYNDAMIKNKVGVASSTPTNLWKSGVLAQIAGISEKDYNQIINTGALPSSVYNKYQSSKAKAAKYGGGELDIQSMALDQLMGSIGANINVRDISGVSPTIRDINAKKGASEEPSTLKDMNTLVANQLQQIVVNGNISLNGNLIGGTAESHRAYTTGNPALSLMTDLPNNGMSSQQGIR